VPRAAHGSSLAEPARASSWSTAEPGRRVARRSRTARTVPIVSMTTVATTTATMSQPGCHTCEAAIVMPVRTTADRPETRATRANREARIGRARSAGATPSSRRRKTVAEACRSTRRSAAKPMPTARRVSQTTAATPSLSAGAIGILWSAGRRSVGGLSLRVPAALSGRTSGRTESARGTSALQGSPPVRRGRARSWRRGRPGSGLADEGVEARTVRAGVVRVPPASGLGGVPRTLPGAPGGSVTPERVKLRLVTAPS